MAEQQDPTFFERADAHIGLSNEQLKIAEGARVAASTAFAAARFNAWMCANMNPSAERMAERREEAERIFTDEYRRMFLENYDDYINNWNRYNTGAPGVVTRDKI